VKFTTNTHQEGASELMKLLIIFHHQEKRSSPF